MSSVVERFLKYVTIDTQSKEDADCFPSTEKQKDLAHLLADELRKIGAQMFSLSFSQMRRPLALSPIWILLRRSADIR